MMKVLEEDLRPKFIEELKRDKRKEKKKKKLKDNSDISEKITKKEEKV